MCRSTPSQPAGQKPASGGVVGAIARPPANRAVTLLAVDPLVHTSKCLCRAYMYALQGAVARRGPAPARFFFRVRTFLRRVKLARCRLGSCARSFRPGVAAFESARQPEFALIKGSSAVHAHDTSPPTRQRRGDAQRRTAAEGGVARMAAAHPPRPASDQTLTTSVPSGGEHQHLQGQQQQQQQRQQQQPRGQRRQGWPRRRLERRQLAI